MHKPAACVAFVTAVFVGAVACTQDVAADERTKKTPSAKEIEFFEKQIAPILKRRCYQCHSHESGKAKGGLVLDSRRGSEKGGSEGAAIVPGKPGESVLMEAVRYESYQMPPEEKLAASEIALLEKWIAMGAPDPRESQAPEIDPEKLWALRPVSKLAVPAVKDVKWPRDDIDAFILAELEAAGLNFAEESKETLALYGVGDKQTDQFGRQCLLARRFAEAGLRFVQVSLGGWDHHNKIATGLPDRCAVSDKPIAGLLTDLKTRGLLDDTLVLWGGEFGRTPHAQNGDGREHNHHGFTMWMAGGGVKGGITHGVTDEFGYYGVEGQVHINDLHATMLHLMGLDHERLTFEHHGRPFRLTDIAGNVVKEIIA